MSIRTPINEGVLQSDLDCAGFDLLNFDGGSGLPDGGTTGQLLQKQSSTDGDADWATVTGGGGLPVTNIKDAPYSAAGDGVTDDTAALQAAIDALAAVGGGRIYFPPGTYLIGGALQETGGRNAQILLPIVAVTGLPVTIELIGALAPPTQVYVGSPLPAPTAYSIIKSTLTGGTGTASFIAGKEFSGSDFWDNVQLIVRDLVFQAPPNPTFTAFNCFNLMGPHFERVLIHTGSLDINVLTEPTNTNAVGIKLAPSAHSTGQRLNVVNVYGFYAGMQDGELAEIHANFIGCKRGTQITWNHHLSTYRHLGIFNCTRGIVAAGPNLGGFGTDDGTHYLRVLAYAGERSNSGGGYGPAWSDLVYDVDDASNLLYGDLKWLTVTAGVGRNHTFTKNGGTNLLTTELGSNSPCTVANLPASPTLGQTSSVNDGTAALAWGATVTGGGSTKYLVFYNGTNWTVMGK